MNKENVEYSSQAISILAEAFHLLVFEGIECFLSIDRATSEATKKMIVYCVEESCKLQESWGKEEK